MIFGIYLLYPMQLSVVHSYSNKPSSGVLPIPKEQELMIKIRVSTFAMKIYILSSTCTHRASSAIWGTQCRLVTVTCWGPNFMQIKEEFGDMPVWCRLDHKQTKPPPLVVPWPSWFTVSWQRYRIFMESISCHAKLGVQNMNPKSCILAW